MRRNVNNTSRRINRKRSRVWIWVLLGSACCGAVVAGALVAAILTTTSTNPTSQATVTSAIITTATTETLTLPATTAVSTIIPTTTITSTISTTTSPSCTIEDYTSQYAVTAEPPLSNPISLYIIPPSTNPKLSFSNDTFSIELTNLYMALTNVASMNITIYDDFHTKTLYNVEVPNNSQNDFNDGGRYIFNAIQIYFAPLNSADVVIVDLVVIDVCPDSKVIL